VDSTSDIVEQSSDEAMLCQDGVWYKEISRGQAWDIRCDVQLYHTDIEYGNRIATEYSSPGRWRELWYRHQDGWGDTTAYTSCYHSWWGYKKFYIRVDGPDKEEYNPSDTETR